MLENTSSPRFCLLGERCVLLRIYSLYFAKERLCYTSTVSTTAYFVKMDGFVRSQGRLLEADARREARLHRRRERERERHASETVEEREVRLSTRRERDRARRASQSANVRVAVLQHGRERRASEAAEEREVR